MLKLPMIAALAVLLPMPALAAPAEGGIKDPWVRINPAPGRPAAGYFTMTNGAEADALVAAEAPGARIELHTVSLTEGVMRMRKIDKLPLAPGESVAFKSGSYHLMLFGLSAPGKSLPLTLIFESGARRTVEADVRMAGAAPR